MVVGLISIGAATKYESGCFPTPAFFSAPAVWNFETPAIKAKGTDETNVRRTTLCSRLIATLLVDDLHRYPFASQTFAAD